MNTKVNLSSLAELSTTELRTLSTQGCVHGVSCEFMVAYLRAF